MGDKTDIWTIKAALDWTCGYLERKGDENPRVSAQWLLSEACGLTRIELYMNAERPLSPDERDVLRAYVARRGAGEPLQYIVGEAPFRYLTLKVRPGVLIPRPETEVLVSEALACLPEPPQRVAAWNAEAAEQEAAAVADLKQKMAELSKVSGAEDVSGEDSENAEGEGRAAAFSEDAPRAAFADQAAGASSVDAADDAQSGYFLVADICTGSGCIACSVASERPDTRVIAVDIDAGAVSLARENVEALGLADKVRVLRGDLGAPIPERYLGRFDLVVSNPPYVPTGVLRDIPREVTDFEPALALDGGADGLDVLRRLLPWCAHALKSGGSFAFELHETCLDAAAEAARGAGFADVRVKRDLAGRPRVLLGLKR